MQKNLLGNKKHTSIEHAQKYAQKYFRDLQHHFNLTDIQMIQLLKNCIYGFKKNTTEKKWWQIF